MNPFFEISKKEELPEDAFALKNLGSQQAWITSGRRGSDFWGTSGTSSKTTYRDIKDEDYDQQFVRKLVRWKPVYNIGLVIDHHYNYYLTSNEHQHDDFLKHMRYVILPILKKKSNSEVCAQLFEEWLNDRKIQKPSLENIRKTSLKKTVHRIHFDDLSWSDFERLIFAFVKRMRTWKTIDWLGQAGQDDGQDIWGESLGKTYCYLCANYQALTNRKANDDIDKLVKHNAIPDYLIVVCGGKVSAGVNKSIKAYAQSKGINNVEIWSGADIEENLRLQAPDLLHRFFEGYSFPEAGNNFTPRPINKSAFKKADQYHKVFISYAKEDYKYAVELYDYLNHHGYEPWLDKKSLLPGSNWDIEIKRALKQSDFIILLLSSTSVSKRGYIQREYKLALQYSEEKVEDDIYIIPVLINDCEVPISLNRFQWVQYDEDAFGLIVQSLDIQRMKLTGKDDAEQVIESQKREGIIKDNNLSLSKKVHDVVANGLYRIMSDLDHHDTIDRNLLLGQLEKIYEHSRDISYDQDGAKGQDFSAILAQAIILFATESCRITIVGNNKAIWTGFTKQEENNVQHIIEHLMTVFVRDGNAKNILMRFGREDQKVYLKCQYEGDVQISQTNLNSVLTIIDQTKATIGFMNESKGATIDITYNLQK